MYDRYLADVLLSSGDKNVDSILETGVHLNRWLVEEGFAVAVGR